MNITGDRIINGKVMRLKVCHPEAPCKSDASKISFGIDRIMAKKTSIKSGVQSQASAITIKEKAKFGLNKLIIGTPITYFKTTFTSSQIADGEKKIPAISGETAKGRIRIV
jgi:hypothetical protein